VNGASHFRLFPQRLESRAWILFTDLSGGTTDAIILALLTVSEKIRSYKRFVWTLILIAVLTLRFLSHVAQEIEFPS
jgi:hypothetical protein